MSGQICARTTCALPVAADEEWSPWCSQECCAADRDELAEESARKAVEALKAAWLEEMIGREFAWKEALPS